MLTIGDKFPAFDLKAVVSTDPKKAFTQVNDKSDEGKWKIVSSGPRTSPSSVRRRSRPSAS